ncbi:MAG: secondary thiamine-phosphate synthase enzyme YjbQ [Anaerolineae bacterium]|jgi:secondary thiamine-phosphate synthase enzyme
MTWSQTTFRLPPLARGCHLITAHVLEHAEGIGEVSIGLAHVFVHHTSASLALGEKADPTVRADVESHLNVMVPENAPYYRHTFEGPDDMPAHIKAMLLGSSVTIPITGGRLALGAWQGIYLCEHRDRASGRRLTVTISGATRD